MLNDLKNLFSRTWSAFHAELNRREPEDQVAELLTAMRREMVEARASLPVLDEAVARARAERERERGELEACRRRRDLAERIGDAETARVAEEFAARHARRVEVLEEKLRAAQAERRLRKEEIERMSSEYRKAEANRFALVARLRAQQRVSPEELASPGPAAAPHDVEERLRELKRRMGRE
jgi:chromosome segregation ATPase